MRWPARIALLINSLGSGGAQRQIIILANQLSSHGVEVHLVYYSASSHLAKDIADRVVLHRVDRPRLGGRISVIFAVIARIRRIQPQALISFLDAPGLIAFLHHLITPDCRWIFGDRNLDSYRSSLYLRFKTYILSRADAIVANSNAQTKLLERESIGLRSRLFYIGNAVSLANFKSIGDPISCSHSDGRLRVLILGRLSKQKNPELLIDAISRLTPDEQSGLIFDWFGEDDPDWPEARRFLTERAAAAGVNLNFFRSTNNPFYELSRSDALLLCSIYEGSPNVVLEAMSRKTLVISSDVSDVPFLLDGGKRGLVFRSSDASSLATQLSTLLSLDLSTRVELVESAYSFAITSFTEAAMANRYLSILDDLQPSNGEIGA